MLLRDRCIACPLFCFVRYEMRWFWTLLNSLQGYEIAVSNSMRVTYVLNLTAHSVSYSNLFMLQKIFTHFHIVEIIFNFIFILYSLSVTLLSSSCSVSRSNYETVLAANSVILKNLISAVYINTRFKQRNSCVCILLL